MGKGVSHADIHPHFESSQRRRHLLKPRRGRGKIPPPPPRGPSTLRETLNPHHPPPEKKRGRRGMRFKSPSHPGLVMTPIMFWATSLEPRGAEKGGGGGGSRPQMRIEIRRVDGVRSQVWARVTRRVRSPGSQRISGVQFGAKLKLLIFAPPRNQATARRCRCKASKHRRNFQTLVLNLKYHCYSVRRCRTHPLRKFRNSSRGALTNALNQAIG